MSSPDPTRRVALVTGVSRYESIGWAVVRRLRADGLRVVATGWPDHDAEQSWSASAIGDDAVRRHDLGDAATAPALVDEVFDEFGQLDIVVAAHARSSNGVVLADLTTDDLDRCWQVNVRSIVLLAQRWAERRGDGSSVAPPTGRLVFFTSGQHLAPMAGEIPYALSKGALHQLAATLDRAMSEVGVVANCVNPGPVDTGWADAELYDAVAEMFPDRRWTTPDETADLVEFLVSERGAVFRGQVLDAEHGLHRFA